MIAGSEPYDLFPDDLDVDLVPPQDWASKEAEMAAAFADFLRRAPPACCLTGKRDANEKAAHV